MQIVQRRHTRGRPATVVQPHQPPGDYHFIEESGKLYHHCFVHREVAERTMLTLQASWDELTNKLRDSKSQLKELLADPKPDGKAIAKIQQRILDLQEALSGRSERDRDIFLNFDDHPSECTISAREPARIS